MPEPTASFPRLIEAAFPLRQTSIDSVHEKNVRHGHISTLHIWPARRPLAACRAALIATLLPDPGTPEARRKLVERIGGTLVKRVEFKKIGGKTVPVEREETVGGVLHWERESDPEMARFRQEIRQAFGGRAPRVLDPFAGGGAIPLEAMRLGCEVTANDINPVAWLTLKATLEYPQRLSGQTRPLPEFALKDRDFIESYLKAKGLKGTGLAAQLDALGFGKPGDDQTLILETSSSLYDADLAWHVRAWGKWVLSRARAELASRYPVLDGRQPIAYLWARTVTCKNCRATIPLLKTRWLCKKEKKRVVLTLKPSPERTGVIFGVEADVPIVGTNTAQRREHDRRLGAGTMTRAGAECTCCGQPGTVAMTPEDIRHEGVAGRLGATMTAVVLEASAPDGKKASKDYRPPTAADLAGLPSGDDLDAVFRGVPFGSIDEPTPSGGSGASRAFSVKGYGFDRWSKLFTLRQLLSLASLVKLSREAAMRCCDLGYPQDWSEALSVYLAAMFDRLANQSSTVAHWNNKGENIEGTFARFALPIIWDFAEVNPLSEATGGFPSASEWIGLAVSHLLGATAGGTAKVRRGSAIASRGGDFDVILTDPPYYDAIPYSDLMDFFYVWLRRTLNGLSPDIDASFSTPLGPKWDDDSRDGELIDDASRHDGDSDKSKATYEDGMARSFEACHRALSPEGRLVVVFAHKHPDAWETLVSAIIRAGFVVDGSWPIQTERTARTRSLSSAALSSSVWLVCRKRPADARPGWDNRVLAEMKTRIAERLRDFWDAGIRGPDFVWAATGPALEAYSQHPVVKKANEPGKAMEVSEFLRHVRRLVVDFVVGRVLSPGASTEEASSLDDVTTYYLLHRNDFGTEDAPAGASILYSVSCGLSDSALADQWDILTRSGGASDNDEDEERAAEAEDAPEEGSGNKVRLKPWQQRKRSTLGYEAPGGRSVPLIDQVHRLMHLWRAGEESRVDEYLDSRALRRNALFHQILQALIELAEAGSEERSLLESISNHTGRRGVPGTRTGELFPEGTE